MHVASRYSYGTSLIKAKAHKWYRCILGEVVSFYETGTRTPVDKGSTYHATRHSQPPSCASCGSLEAQRPALLPSSLPFFRTVRPLRPRPTDIRGPRSHGAS